MMKGALPPSSSEAFLIVGAHCSNNSRPTSVDPVKDSFRTIGLDVSALPTSAALLVGRMFRTPGGIPACSARAAIASAESGVSSAGFATIVHPAASAAATLRISMALGKFQGVIAAHTPIGCFTTSVRTSPELWGMTSP